MGWQWDGNGMERILWGFRFLRLFLIVCDFIFFFGGGGNGSGWVEGVGSGQRFDPRQNFS